MKRLKIEVSQEDIDTGFQYTMDRCAIAKAIQRQFPAVKNVQVDGGLVWIGGLRFRASRAQERFIKAWDVDRKAVQPSTFILSPYYNYTKEQVTELALA